MDGCKGQYAYNNETCNESCIVIEGIFWAMVSHMGRLYTSHTAVDQRSKWLMITPDAGMDAIPEDVGNAKTLQEGSPGL